MCVASAAFAAQPKQTKERPMSTQPRGYTIPTIDLAGEEHRQVVVDREKGQYLGHPTTVLLEDNKTMVCVYPKGHGRGAIVLGIVGRGLVGGLRVRSGRPVAGRSRLGRLDRWADAYDVQALGNALRTFRADAGVTPGQMLQAVFEADAPAAAARYELYGPAIRALARAEVRFDGAA